MSSAPQHSENPAESARRIASMLQQPSQPFFGIIDSILVNDPVEFPFDGAVGRDDAKAIWTWVVRDLAPDLIDPEASEADPAVLEALEALIPDLLSRARDALAAAASSRELERRMIAQLGGESAWERLPIVLNALKCRALLEKAQAFGRATNSIPEEAALAMAMQSMPLQDQAIAALLMQAAVGHVANPGRLVAATVRLAGAPSDIAISRAGFGPLIDALLAHAQSQLPALSPMGAFGDVDLLCRAVDRFHRLMRAVNFVELGRLNHWAVVVSALTKTVSERLEPRLREVSPDVNKALRRPREGADRLDSDDLLSALNGVYLLATVRDCRDSLALNALFEQTWTQVGQALEMHLQRNLDILRENPADANTTARLEAGIKMAELRYGAEYADILRRARDTAERRTVS
jgi:hypothetical protein